MEFPLRIHYAFTIPAAQSAPDANLGSNGPELHHGKVSIRRSYSSSYICSSVVPDLPHVILRLGPPVPFFISLHVLDLVITLVTSSRRLFRVSTTDIACTLGLVHKDPCLDVLVWISNLGLAFSRLLHLVSSFSILANLPKASAAR